MRTFKTFLYTLLLLLTIVGCDSVIDDKADEVNEYVKVGDRVPTFSVATVCTDGTTSTFSTETLTGETVIVLFNTSCGDCQRDLPLLNNYYLEHCNEPGFQMVAISREEEAESVAAYWQANNLSIPYSAQTDRNIYDLFASSIIPRIYFCNAEGIVTKVCVETFN